MKFKRRELLRNIAKAGLLLPFSHQVLFQGQVAAATGNNIVFFYYPNGCVTSDMSSGGFQTQGLRAAGTPFKVHNKYLNGVSGGAHEGGRFVLRAGQGDTTADHLIADRLGTSVLNLGLRAESLQDKFVTSWKYGAAQTNMSNPTDVANYLQSQSGGTIEPGDNGQNILLETLTQDFEELRALAIQAGKNDGLTSKLDLHVAALEALQPTAEGARAAHWRGHSP